VLACNASDETGFISQTPALFVYQIFNRGKSRCLALDFDFKVFWQGLFVLFLGYYKGLILLKTGKCKIYAYI